MYTYDIMTYMCTVGDDFVEKGMPKERTYRNSYIIYIYIYRYGVHWRVKNTFYISRDFAVHVVVLHKYYSLCIYIYISALGILEYVIKYIYICVCRYIDVNPIVGRTLQTRAARQRRQMPRRRRWVRMRGAQVLLNYTRAPSHPSTRPSPGTHTHARATVYTHAPTHSATNTHARAHTRAHNSIYYTLCARVCSHCIWGWRCV